MTREQSYRVNTQRAFVLGMALAMCVLAAAAHAQTAVRSYYVRADGDDANNGRSEDKPFKTLEKAAEAAKMGVIKTITVIGPVVEPFDIRDTGTDEILITGKPDATEREKAKISGWNRIGDAKVRFTHITIDMSGGYFYRSSITLGAGAQVTGTIKLSNCALTMTDNAVAQGIELESTCQVTMSGNALVTGDDAGYGNGSIYAADGNTTITMSGNAKIANGRKHGIYAYHNP